MHIALKIYGYIPPTELKFSLSLQVVDLNLREGKFPP